MRLARSLREGRRNRNGQEKRTDVSDLRARPHPGQEIHAEACGGGGGINDPVRRSAEHHDCDEDRKNSKYQDHSVPFLFL
jgi:hypothetical protein